TASRPETCSPARTRSRWPTCSPASSSSPTRSRATQLNEGRQGDQEKGRRGDQEKDVAAFAPSPSLPVCLYCLTLRSARTYNRAACSSEQPPSVKNPSTLTRHKESRKLCSPAHNARR